MTYQEFKDSLLNYMGHWPDPDPAFEAALDVLITKAEAKVHTLLRHPFMVSSPFLSELSTGGERPYIVPADLLEPHSLFSGAGAWEYLTLQQYLVAKDRCVTTPRIWTMVGQEILVAADDDGTAVWSYYAKPEPIADNPNGRLFTAFPQLYHAAAAAEAARYLREPTEIVAIHMTDFERYLAEVKLAAWSAGVPKNQPLKVR